MPGHGSAGFVGWKENGGVQPPFLLQGLPAVLAAQWILVHDLVHRFGRRQLPGLTGMAWLPTAFAAHQTSNKSSSHNNKIHRILTKTG